MGGAHKVSDTERSEDDEDERRTVLWLKTCVLPVSRPCAKRACEIEEASATSWDVCPYLMAPLPQQMFKKLDSGTWTGACPLWS